MRIKYALEEEMKKDCKLIGTLPSLHDDKGIDLMLSSKEIDEVRFNSGVNELLTVREIIQKLKILEEWYKKKIWLDLKGRQLRVNAWADPFYEAVELNHEIEIEYPAKIIFRGGNASNIVHTLRNKIVLDRPPERAVGKGQSVNILAKSLEIKGYLTEHDKELITLSRLYGLNNYMASFVENNSDLEEIYNLNQGAKVIAKIESVKGLDFIRSSGIHLMAARDDLYIETGQKIAMLKYLKEIIQKDKDAICASRIFHSLNIGYNVSLADYEDLELMYSYGYRNFMLGDEIRGPKLVKALDAWRSFVNE